MPSPDKLALDNLATAAPLVVPGPRPGKERRHLPFLDGIRGIAALYVTAHHIFAYTWLSSNKAHSSSPVWLNWLQYGHYAVMVFIVLSGFCLALPFICGPIPKNGWIKGFFYRRSRRILPTYYAAVMFSLGVVALCPPAPTKAIWGRVTTTTGGLLSHLLLLQDAYAPGQINYAHWSVALEWHIYFLFPLLLWAAIRFGPGVTAAATLLAGVSIRALLDCGDVIPWSFATQYVGGFALGMWAASVAFARAHPRWPIWPAVATVACLAGHLITPIAYRYLLKDLLISLLSSLLLIWLARTAPSWLLSPFQNGMAVALGTMSYSLYLVHPAVLELCEVYIVRRIGFASTLQEFWFAEVLGLPIIIACAYCFFLVCERPFLTKARKAVAP